MLPLNAILWPTDFSKPSLEALGAAVELATHFDALLCLVHVLPTVPPIPPDPIYASLGPKEYQRAVAVDAESRLNRIMRECIPAGVRTRIVTGRGDVANEIIRIAQDQQADVIVLATHGLTGWLHVLFGSVAEKVLRLAHRPVLVIPPSSRDTKSDVPEGGKAQ
jgi:universal stress protein A